MLEKKYNKDEVDKFINLLESTALYNGFTHRECNRNYVIKCLNEVKNNPNRLLAISANVLVLQTLVSRSGD